MSWQERIELNPAVLAGKPVVKGTRIAVELIVELLADGWSEAALLEEYPGLTAEDIQACLVFAHRSLAGERVHERMPVRSAR